MDVKYSDNVKTVELIKILAKPGKKKELRENRQDW